MRDAFRAIYTIWLREFRIFTREKARVIMGVAQPLIYLSILGIGLSAGARLNASSQIPYIKYMYPGVIGMSILFTSIFSALSIIWDREFGFLKEVLVAPVPRWAVAIGKSLGGATVAMVQAVLLVLIAPLVGISLSVPMLLELVSLAFLLSVALTSLGVVIASRMQSMQSFQMVMNFLVMPLYFLSGALFPISSAPAPMRAVMAFDPVGYGVDAIRHVVFAHARMARPDGTEVPLAEVARATGLLHWSLSTDVAVTALVAVGFTAVAAWAFSKASES